MQNMEQESRSWLKLSIIMAFIIGYGVLSVAGSGGDTGLNLDDDNVINLLKGLQVVSVLILFILPALMFSIFWTKQRVHYLGVSTKPKLSTLLIAGTGMIIAMPMINWLSELNQHMQLPEALNGIEMWMKNSEAKAAELTEAFTRGTSINVLIINLFVVAFMAALSEELFFRGILQKVAIECFKNKHIGVWFCAIMFSAFHMQFYGFIPRMLMGAYLGYLFLWSGSLWPGIVAHFLNNGLAVLLIWLVNRDQISVDADKMGSLEGETLLVITSAVMVIASMILVYRIEEKRKSVLPLA